MRDLEAVSEKVRKAMEDLYYVEGTSVDEE
jgi:hypothetical protein